MMITIAAQHYTTAFGKEVRSPLISTTEPRWRPLRASSFQRFTLTTHTHIHTDTSTHTYTHTQIHRHTHTHTHTQIHRQTHTHTHTHTHTKLQTTQSNFYE